MKSLLSRSAIALALGTALIALPALAMDPALKTDKDKNSYMIGMLWGKQLQDIKGDVDMAMVQKGLADSFAGEKTLMTEEEAQKVSGDFRTMLQGKREAERAKAAAENKAKGVEFLAENKTLAGVKTTESGLQYMVLTEGTGAKPKAKPEAPAKPEAKPAAKAPVKKAPAKKAARKAPAKKAPPKGEA